VENLIRGLDIRILMASALPIVSPLTSYSTTPFRTPHVFPEISRRRPTRRGASHDEPALCNGHHIGESNGTGAARR
jgi:hypothetical protein